MRALLRYATLKSLRDGTLGAFLIAPMLMPVAALSGVTFDGFHLRFPMFLNPHYTAAQNAASAAGIAGAVGALFAAIPAFWAFRSEIRSRSIGLFAFAARPIVIVLSLILFAAAIGFAGWISAIVLITVLTTALPPNIGLIAVKMLMATIASSSVGAMIVTISAEPAMIVCSYLGCLTLIPWMEKAKGPVQLTLPLIVSVICFAIATFLLERRCAS